MKRAFTLIELLVVIAIAALLIAILMPTVSRFTGPTGPVITSSGNGVFVIDITHGGTLASSLAAFKREHPLDRVITINTDPHNSLKVVVLTERIENNPDLEKK